MITITVDDKNYEFPDVDFGDLEVFEVCRNIQKISNEYRQAYPSGSDMDEVCTFLQDYGHELIKQLDYALGENACLEMFGNRINIDKLRTVAEQIADGVAQAWGSKTPCKPSGSAAYPQHGQKTGKHKNAYQKPQRKSQNDLVQKAKSMSKEEKAALLAALLE